MSILCKRPSGLGLYPVNSLLWDHYFQIPFSWETSAYSSFEPWLRCPFLQEVLQEALSSDLSCHHNIDQAKHHVKLFIKLH